MKVWKTIFGVTFGGAILATGLNVIAGRAFFDIVILVHGGHIGKPGIYGVGVMFVGLALPILTIISIAIIVSTARLKAEQDNAPASAWIVSALLACILTAGIFTIRPLRFALPGFVIGKALHSSLAFYVVSLVQCALGAWMLGLFTRLRNAMKIPNHTSEVIQQSADVPSKTSM